MLHNPTGKKRIGLALLLSMLGILAPLNIDMYLPSFPLIAEELNAHVSLVQMSLTACLIGLAVGQIIIGPLSDSQGRRKPLIISIFLFALSSLLCAVAPTIELLIIGRFLQGLTAAGGVALSKAVVSDVFTGREMTKFFALLMVINAVAPMAAPIAGGAILALPFAGWETIFYFLGFLGLVMAVIIIFRLPETLPKEERMPSSLGASVRTMGSLMKTRPFIGYALVAGMIHGGSFAYVAGTPFVYQEIYGVTPQTFGLLFGINGIAMILGSYIIGKFGGIVSEHRLLQGAVFLASGATFLLLIMTIVEGPLASIVTLIFIYMIAVGMTFTSSFTLAMHGQGHRAGSASAVVGMLPLVIGSLVSPLVGINETSAVPMGAILFGSSVLGLIVFFTLTGKKATV
ncbi:Bcr/CflA family efflux MFS transporter [Planococcus shenhongbingii]|uniref:Bcr/CflA family efflux transporter n=1 Tax=Planococcus shenhongbingii TaxID=3058398 RepID=A0ABT8NEQ4_9BACL|nr:Bcr/CflA family efflux MFS transporter [Planococcus sp. N017]MDN7246387.1 Bcr/CflA family efflux MFS transporter [Planococcus sp. N017]